LAVVVSGAALAAVVLDESGSVVGRDMIEDMVGVGSRLVDVDMDDMKCVGELDELGGSVVVADVDVDLLEVEVEIEIGIEVVF
jgi:hypothetical protein